MPKPPETEHELATDAENLAYTSVMKVFGGFAWGTLLTVFVGSTLVLVPQVPRPWLWSLLPIWAGLSIVGIVLQWPVVRGACPKCGCRLVVPPLGKRCPQCRSYLKAVNSKIVRA